MSLFVRESGPATAPTIVFLHGGGLSGQQWLPQIERLSEYHCLAPDLPEQGQSHAVGPLTLQGATAHVCNLITTRAHNGRAHVVASSFGGTIALNLLNVAPELITTVLTSGGAAGLGRVLGAISNAGANIYRVVPLNTLIRLSYRQFAIPPQYHTLFRNDIARTANADFTRKITQAMIDLRLPLHATAPVLAVVGERESWAAKQAARTIARRLPNARGVLVPGVGHIWNWQAPDLFAALVRAWITNTPLPAALRPL